MWQRDSVVGGTPSIGPARSYGGGGGIGADIPGTTWSYGVVNYTMFKCTDKAFVTLRNEFWRDADGERSGFKGNYSSHAIGYTYNFSPFCRFVPKWDIIAIGIPSPLI